MLTLPVEVIVYVLLHIQLPDIQACRNTCHLLRLIINSSAVIQYKTDLDLTGNTALSISYNIHHSSISQRHSILARYRDAWNNLSWTIRCVHLPPYSGEREYSAGIRTTSEDSERSLSILALPSLVNDTPAREWKYPDLGVDVLTFHINWDLNLLLIVGQPSESDDTRGPCIYVRCASNPTSPLSDICDMINISAAVLSGDPIILRAAGSVFGAVFGPSNTRTLMFWDYLKGSFLGYLYETDSTTLDSFVLLDSDTFIVAQNARGYRPIVPMINLYHINGAKIICNLVASFHLPGLTNDVILSHLQIRVDWPSSVPRVSPGPTARNAKLPFHTSQEEHVVVLRWMVRALKETGSDQNVWTALTLITRLETFLTAKPKSRCPAETVVYEWEEWGPQHSRIFTASQYGVWDVSGSRFIHFPWAPSGSLSVLDFAKHASALWTTNRDPFSASDIGAHASPETDYSAYIVPRTLPTVISKPMIFAAGNVSTSLPYCVVTRHIELPGPDLVSDLMCDAERVICRLGANPWSKTEVAILEIADLGV